MEKKYVHQWYPHTGPECDSRTRHWTEIRMTTDELLGMLGCASGSVLISRTTYADGSVILTVDEHLEVPPCPLAGDGGSRSGPATG